MNISAGKSVGVEDGAFDGAALGAAAAAFGWALNSFTSAAIILLLGPVPWICPRSRPFSSASLLASGLTKILEPDFYIAGAGWAAACVGAGVAA